jgi:hypothetical protein
MSAHQLHRMLGFTYRAAWFMAHLLRHAMKDDVMQLTGIVEVDEAYIGGPRRKREGRPGPNCGVKTPILALVERGGRVRAFGRSDIRVLEKDRDVADGPALVEIQPACRLVAQIMNVEIDFGQLGAALGR